MFSFTQLGRSFVCHQFGLVASREMERNCDGKASRGKTLITALTEEVKDLGKILTHSYAWFGHLHLLYLRTTRAPNGNNLKHVQRAREGTFGRLLVWELVK